MRHFYNSPPPLPEYPPFYIKCGSQNRPHLSRIYPPFLQLYAMLPESTPPSQNILPPPLLEMRPFQNLPILPESSSPLLHHYMRHSHNRPLPPSNILMRHSRNPPPTPPPFKHLHATLPESTPPSQNIPSFKHQYAMVGHSGLQTFLAKNILLFLTSIREPLGIYSSLPEYTPSLFLQCDSHRIYPSLLPE